MMGLVETAVRNMPEVEGSIGWEPLVLTLDKIKWLWEQLRQFPVVFDDFGRGNFEEFCGKLINPRNVFVDIGPNLGLACGFGIRPGLDMVIHLVMFDRRLRGREGLFREILTHYFQKLDLRRATALVPDDAPTSKKLVQRLGFGYEGTMRKAILRDGRYVDMHVYGVLREELLDG